MTIMACSARSPGLLSRLWEWLGWRSTRIAAHRTEARTVRSDAERRLENAHERDQRSRAMTDWLARRSEQNHIAEALSSVLDHPRRRRFV